mmetsp:Transcript_10019/g.24746  ORF Transcript_10019/g.24746 Transcript_10019/m.24746 type:complete len:475 (-) Transcript_10019:207-1631(-)|eukprot:g1812.t1
MAGACPPGPVCSSGVSPAAPFCFPRTRLVSRNRTVLAAMTNRQSFADGTLSSQEVEFLVRRARGGFGIVTTACAHVTKDGQGFPGEFGVWEDRFLPNLRLLAAALRREGALSLVQIFHAGLQAPQELTGEQPKSPSGPLEVGRHLSADGWSRELSEEEVWALVEAFADAARRCYDAGFDGVELHGAHGYLINQFLGCETNFRSAAQSEFHGESVEGRFRFLFEVIKAIRRKVPGTAAAFQHDPGARRGVKIMCGEQEEEEEHSGKVGKDNAAAMSSASSPRPFLVGVRISPERNCGVLLQDSLELARRLRDVNIDFLHLSCWDIFQTSSQMMMNQDSNSNSPAANRTLTEHFTHTIPGLPPVITTGKIWTHDDCRAALGPMRADFVGSARASIGNPDWAHGVCGSSPQSASSADGSCHSASTASNAGPPESYQPKLPPYSEEYLKKQSLSDIFVYYMRRWRFVHRAGKILPFRG